jgi:glycine cleavage system H protein
MADAHLAYRRAQFKTRLPTDRKFTKAHLWLQPVDAGTVRIGLTRFATRMLGEVVEYEFEARPGSVVTTGDTVGWIEGFKAVSDLFVPMDGRFAGPNPDLDASMEQIHHSPYDRGWLYSVVGELPDDCLTPEQYAAFLDGTIDRMMGKST